MNTRPYRMAYNGRQIGGRFATEAAALASVCVEEQDRRTYPNRSLWSVDLCARAEQTRALIIVSSFKPYAEQQP